MSQAKFKITRQGEDSDWELWVRDIDSWVKYGHVKWELHGTYRYHLEATKAMEKMVSKTKVEEFLYDFDGKRIN